MRFFFYVVFCWMRCFVNRFGVIRWGWWGLWLGVICWWLLGGCWYGVCVVWWVVDCDGGWWWFVVCVWFIVFLWWLGWVWLGCVIGVVICGWVVGIWSLGVGLVCCVDVLCYVVCLIGWCDVVGGFVRYVCWNWCDDVVRWGFCGVDGWVVMLNVVLGFLVVGGRLVGWCRVLVFRCRIGWWSCWNWSGWDCWWWLGCWRWLGRWFFVMFVWVLWWFGYWMIRRRWGIVVVMENCWLVVVEGICRVMW